MIRFNALLRRPKSRADGMVAEMFAGNGPDADEVTKLGLTQYQDARVSVLLIEAGTKEELGSFEAAVRRPVPLVSGMVAQFLGENGADADKIVALCLTHFVDKAVVVDVSMLQTPEGAAVPAETGRPAADHGAFAAALYKSSLWTARQVMDALAHDVVDGVHMTGLPKPKTAAFTPYTEVRDWMWPRLRAALHVESMRQASPEAVRGLFGRLGLSEIYQRWESTL